MGSHEGELRKKWRFLEKKKELLAADWEALKGKETGLIEDKKGFEEWAAKIRETSIRLAEERDKVLQEKGEYDYEREVLEKQRMELDMQRSIMQSDFIRAQELGHELEHREKMLQMLKYNKEVDITDILMPTYTSCAGQNKVDPRQFLLN
jgi:hypothetical protein